MVRLAVCRTCSLDYSRLRGAVLLIWIVHGFGSLSIRFQILVDELGVSGIRDSDSGPRLRVGPLANLNVQAGETA